jgi:hypothetical protein
MSKIEIGSHTEQRLDGFRLWIETKQEANAKHSKPFSAKVNATAPPGNSNVNTVMPATGAIAVAPKSPPKTVLAKPMVHTFVNVSTAEPPVPLTKNVRVVGKNGTVKPGEKKVHGKTGVNAGIKAGDQRLVIPKLMIRRLVLRLSKSDEEVFVAGLWVE